MMTIKDIKRLIYSLGSCLHCTLKKENNYECPYLLGDTHFCALDCLNIAIDYIDKGEY